MSINTHTHTHTHTHTCSNTNITSCCLSTCSHILDFPVNHRYTLFREAGTNRLLREENNHTSVFPSLYLLTFHKTEVHGCIVNDSWPHVSLCITLYINFISVFSISATSYFYCTTILAPHVLHFTFTSYFVDLD